jgi:hypothetical protein
MFKIPRVNVIESDEGFSIEMLGRTGLKYIQGKVILFIDSEFLVGQPDIAIFANRIVDWHTKKPITDENTKKEIIDNIKRAFTWRGLVIDVEW